MNQWIQRDQSSIWHPFTPLIGSPKPLMVERAQGAKLFTSEGVIIDAIGSWWVNLHGHAHPYIAQKVADQAQVLEHVIFAGFTHQPAIELAERLLEILPDNQDKIFYSDNGSTACEVALKMALQYWYNQEKSRHRVVAIDGGYHGDTFGAMSVGDRSPFSAPFDALLFEVDFLPLPTSDQQDSIIGQFESLCQLEEVAAFIFEPLIQGASGMRMYPAHLLDKLLEIAHSHGVICIADEVMTGFYRTGKMFASDHLTNKPDIMCLSKGLTGGAMAMGATSCSKEIIEAFRREDIMKTFFHGHSFTANPLACVAGLASLDLLQKDTCIRDIQRIESRYYTFVQKIKNIEAIKEIRQMGVILAIELSNEEEAGYFNEARNEIYPFFLERGILMRPLGNVLYLLPPYVITDDELNEVFNVILEFLNT